MLRMPRNDMGVWGNGCWYALFLVSGGHGLLGFSEMVSERFPLLGGG
jgi:hypothetical protein